MAPAHYDKLLTYLASANEVFARDEANLTEADCRIRCLVQIGIKEGVRALGVARRANDCVATKDVAPIAHTNSRPSRMNSSPERPPCVLLIDDDDNALRLMRRLITKVHPDAFIATAIGSGLGMTYLLQASRGGQESAPMPEVVFLEVNMTGTDGFGVLEWIRCNKSLAGVKVIMVTSSEAEADQKRAKALGAHGYLNKYPTPALLGETLAMVAQGKADPARRHSFSQPKAF